MEYTTRGGYALHIGRIPRERIDRFVLGHPMPEPPTRTVEVWGDIPEEVPDHKDPGYQRELNSYWLEMGKQHVALVADAVTISHGVDFGELAELREVALGISHTDTVADFLRYMCHDDDVTEIVALVLYRSTVSDQGIWEASKRYNVRWDGQQLNALVTLGKSKGSYWAEFEARRSAQFVHKEWAEFCELTGPEQSDIVAFFRLSNSLAWLQAKAEGGK